MRGTTFKGIGGGILLVLLMVTGVAFAVPVTLVTSRWGGPYADFQADLLKRFTAEPHFTNVDTYTLPAGISKFVGSISVS